MRGRMQMPQPVSSDSDQEADKPPLNFQAGQVAPHSGHRVPAFLR
jgi:hypothetical protein